MAVMWFIEPITFPTLKNALHVLPRTQVSKSKNYLVLYKPVLITLLITHFLKIYFIIDPLPTKNTNPSCAIIRQIFLCCSIFLFMLIPVSSLSLPKLFYLIFYIYSYWWKKILYVLKLEHFCFDLNQLIFMSILKRLECYLPK